VWGTLNLDAGELPVQPCKSVRYRDMSAFSGQGVENHLFEDFLVISHQLPTSGRHMTENRQAEGPAPL